MLCVVGYSNKTKLGRIITLNQRKSNQYIHDFAVSFNMCLCDMVGLQFESIMQREFYAIRSNVR